MLRSDPIDPSQSPLVVWRGGIVDCGPNLLSVLFTIVEGHTPTLLNSQYPYGTEKFTPRTYWFHPEIEFLSVQYSSVPQKTQQFSV